MPQIDSHSHIFKVFSQTARAYPAKKAIIFKQGAAGDKNLTYIQVYEKTIRFGNILKDSGIKPNDNVSILLENRPEFAITLFALSYTGATAVPLDIQLPPEQIKQLILHSESRILIATQKTYTNVQKYLADIEVIIVDSEDFRKQLDSYKTDYGFGDNKDTNPPAVLFYTSGTTDLPKAVMLTHSNLLSNFDSISRINILKKDDVIISILPLHHAYPFMVTLLTPLLMGATIVYPPGLTSLDLLGCMRQTQTTIFVGVPQIFSLIHRSITEKLKSLPVSRQILAGILGKFSDVIRKSFNVNLGKYLFSDMHKAFGRSLRFMACGGARLDPDVAAAFFSWGFTILEGYGLTETSPVVTFNPQSRPKIGSVGKPIPGVEIKIIKQNQDRIGEVAVKGPNVMAGYYHMLRQTKEVIKDGWFLTGDLGYIDKEGYLYLTGRKKEIIVLSTGKNINPEEVEKHYGQSPFIREICVLSIEASGFLRGIEHLTAIVVPDEEHFRSKNETNIRDKLKWELDNLSTRLPAYKRIRGFVVSSQTLPRTRLGKIMRHKIKSLYVELLETSQPKQKKVKEEDKNVLYSDISQRILSFLKQNLKTEVEINDHLELDLGLDSLGRVELLLELQNSLNLEISDEKAMDFFMSNTVGDLMVKLKNLMPEIPKQTKEEKSFIWQKTLAQRPLQDTLDKINLKPGFWNTALNVIMITIVKLLFRGIFFLRVSGKNNLPPNGPYLICPNHTSYLDGLIVLSSLPYKTALNTYFVSYSLYFEHFLIKRLIKTARLIPLEISFNLIEGLRACFFILKNSKIICYFPEGQRSIDGKVKDFKKGVGILISELNIPVVPAYIEGSFRAWPRYRRLPGPARVRIKFGPMLTLNELVSGGLKGEDIYETITKNLQTEVVNLGHTLKR